MTQTREQIIRDAFEKYREAAGYAAGQQAERDKLERYAYMHGKAFKDGKVIDADIPLYRIREEQ